MNWGLLLDSAAKYAPGVIGSAARIGSVYNKRRKLKAKKDAAGNDIPGTVDSSPSNVDPSVDPSVDDPNADTGSSSEAVPAMPSYFPAATAPSWNRPGSAATLGMTSPDYSSPLLGLPAFNGTDPQKKLKARKDALGRDIPGTESDANGNVLSPVEDDVYSAGYYTPQSDDVMDAPISPIPIDTEEKTPVKRGLAQGGIVGQCSPGTNKLAPRPPKTPKPATAMAQGGATPPLGSALPLTGLYGVPMEGPPDIPTPQALSGLLPQEDVGSSMPGWSTSQDEDKLPIDESISRPREETNKSTRTKDTNKKTNRPIVPEPTGEDPNSGEASAGDPKIQLAKQMADYQALSAARPERPDPSIKRQILGGLIGFGAGMLNPKLGSVLGRKVTQGDYPDQMADWQAQMDNSEKQINLGSKIQDQLTKQQKENDYFKVQEKRYKYARTPEQLLIRQYEDAVAAGNVELAADLKEELNSRGINEKKALIEYKAQQHKLQSSIPVPADQVEDMKKKGVLMTQDEAGNYFTDLQQALAAQKSQAALQQRKETSPAMMAAVMMQEAVGKDDDDEFIMPFEEAVRRVAESSEAEKKTRLTLAEARIQAAKASAFNSIAHGNLANRSPGTGAGTASIFGPTTYSGGGGPAPAPSPANTGAQLTSTPVGPSAPGVPPNGPAPGAPAAPGKGERVITLGGHTFTSSTMPSRIPVEWVDPEYRNIIKSILTYKNDPPTTNSRQGAQILKWLRLVDPDYDATDWAEKKSVVQDYSRGLPARAQQSINTLIEHLGTLSDAMKLLDNKSLRQWNTAGNWIANNTGDPRLNKARLAVAAVNEEMATMLKGGVPDKPLEEAFNKIFNTSDSPQQAQGSIQTAGELMAGRAAAREQFYLDKVRKPMNTPFIQPKQQETLKRLGINYTPIAAPPSKPVEKGRIRVALKSNPSVTGSILDTDWDPNKYVSVP